MSRFRVVASSLRIRQQPSTHNEILGSLPRNVIVEPSIFPWMKSG